MMTVGGSTVLMDLYTVKRCVFNLDTNRTALEVGESEFYFKHRRVIDVLVGWVYGLLLPTTCCMTVTVCTVITVVKTRKVSRWRETVSSTSRGMAVREASMTRMIVGTSVLFIACTTPLVLYRSAIPMFPAIRFGGEHEYVYRILQSFYRATSMVNSTFNFFVYYKFGTKFRKHYASCLPHVCVGTQGETLEMINSNVGDGHGLVFLWSKRITSSVT